MDVFSRVVFFGFSTVFGSFLSFSLFIPPPVSLSYIFHVHFSVSRDAQCPWIYMVYLAYVAKLYNLGGDLELFMPDWVARIPGVYQYL